MVELFYWREYCLEGTVSRIIKWTMGGNNGGNYLPRHKVNDRKKMQMMEFVSCVAKLMMGGNYSGCFPDWHEISKGGNNVATTPSRYKMHRIGTFLLSSSMTKRGMRYCMICFRQKDNFKQGSGSHLSFMYMSSKRRIRWADMVKWYKKKQEFTLFVQLVSTETDLSIW